MGQLNIHCHSCRQFLPEQPEAIGEISQCPNCQNQFRLDMFPSLFHQFDTKKGEVIQEAGLSACFFHAEKKAVIDCASCGRFLCSLCDIDFGDRHLCTNCLERGQDSGQMQDLVTQLTRWDTIALLIALLCVPLYILSFLMAPVILFMVIRFYRRPISLVPRSRLRFWLAGFMGVSILVLWVVVIVSIFS